MATPKPLTEGDEITWTEIEPDGEEEMRTGIVWALAQPLAGMSAWWVQPDDPYGDPGSGPCVLVARASRRHLCGRARAARSALGLTADATVWMPNGGRYIDVGEYYRETDQRSSFARRYDAPAHVVVQRQDDVAMSLFASLCERSAVANDIDYSVDPTP